MAEQFRIFECARASCTGCMPFNLKEAQRKTNNFAIQCPVCNKHWKIQVEGSSCCRIYVRFSSIESAGNKAIVKVKSFQKVRKR